MFEWHGHAAPATCRPFTNVVMNMMNNNYQLALEELSGVFQKLDEGRVAVAVEQIARAKRIALYGVGREGLQVKGFAMRLFHLGLNVSVVGDMTTHPIGAGDLLIVSAGPGQFSTVKALAAVAKENGASTLYFTANPAPDYADVCDHYVMIPAQTMANDEGSKASVLPMGSLFEGAEYVLFECMILKLRDRLGVSPESMRHNHTNLE